MNHRILTKRIVVVIMVIAIGLTIAIFAYFKTRETSAHPTTSLAKPEVISTKGYIVNRTRAIPNPVFVVEVVVRNNGDAGWIKICVIIAGYGRYEIQEKRLYLRIHLLTTCVHTQFFFDIGDWEVPESPKIEYYVACEAAD